MRTFKVGDVVMIGEQRGEAPFPGYRWPLMAMGEVTGIARHEYPIDVNLGERGPRSGEFIPSELHYIGRLD